MNTVTNEKDRAARARQAIRSTELEGGHISADLRSDLAEIVTGEIGIATAIERAYGRQEARRAAYAAKRQSSLSRGEIVNDMNSNAEFWAEIEKTMGTEEARKINMEEAESLFVNDGIAELNRLEDEERMNTKPLGIEAKPVATDIDGVVTGVTIWIYGHEVTLDRDDSFTLLDKVQDALRHQT